MFTLVDRVAYWRGRYASTKVLHDWMLFSNEWVWERVWIILMIFENEGEFVEERIQIFV